MLFMFGFTVYFAIFAHIKIDFRIDADTFGR